MHSRSRCRILRLHELVGRPATIFRRDPLRRREARRDPGMLLRACVKRHVGRRWLLHPQAMRVALAFARPGRFSRGYPCGRRVARQIVAIPLAVLPQELPDCFVPILFPRLMLGLTAEPGAIHGVVPVWRIVQRRLVGCEALTPPPDVQERPFHHVWCPSATDKSEAARGRDVHDVVVACRVGRRMEEVL